MIVISIPKTNHFPAIMARVRSAFPDFTENSVKYAANKISNEIRRGRFDCYDVEVAQTPLTGAGYYRHSAISVSETTVFVRYTID